VDNNLQISGFYNNKEQMQKRMKQAVPVPDVELFERCWKPLKYFPPSITVLRIFLIIW